MSENIKKAIKHVKKELIKRCYAEKWGYITSKGDEYLSPFLAGRATWIEFWDPRRLWVPRHDLIKTREELFQSTFQWKYVSFDDVTEIQFINFCIAFDIDYEEILGTKQTVIFDDDEDFIV